MRIPVYFVAITSICCPEQYEGIGTNGKYIYIRYRGDTLRVHISSTASELYSSDPVLTAIIDDTEHDIIRYVEDKLGVRIIVINDVFDAVEG